MTVPCGGTGVSREKRVLTSSRANKELRFRGFLFFGRSLNLRLSSRTPKSNY
nr:MAG TPA: hypothetical protein [Bacteriophage sp.]